MSVFWKVLPPALLMVVALFAATVVAPVHDQSKVQADHKPSSAADCQRSVASTARTSSADSALSSSSRGSSQARDGVGPAEVRAGMG